MSTLSYCELMLVKVRRGFLSPGQEQAVAQSRVAMQAHAAAVDASAVAAAVGGIACGTQEKQSPAALKTSGQR